MTSPPTYHNPPGLGKPFGVYSHVARAGDLLFVAGQCGITADNTIAGPDVASQTWRAFENIRAILASQGANLRDVVRFTSYLTSADDIGEFYAARERYFAEQYDEPNDLDGGYPPNTLLIVNGLVRVDLVVEVEAIARLRSVVAP
ncbi:endonuclease [Prauserella coralliicola]|nr:endonuclease [Prauserella coralliicola]